MTKPSKNLPVTSVKCSTINQAEDNECITGLCSPPAVFKFQNLLYLHPKEPFYKDIDEILSTLRKLRFFRMVQEHHEAESEY